MNILITGSQGYIGKALCEMLCKKHKVIGLTSSTIKQNDDYKLIKVDLNDTNFINYIPKNIDIIFHLAQSPKYRIFPHGSEDLFNVNMASTFKLLEWSRVNGIKKFFFTSSANVYSENNNKIKENDKVDPQSFYAFSKHASEQMIKYYSSYFKTFILRLFTIYGPEQKDKLIPNIINKINTFSEITLNGKTGISITPLYIDDLINIMNKLIEIDIEKNFHILNVCGDEVVSLFDIIYFLEKILNKKANINFLKLRPSLIIGDNSKIKSIISPIQTINIKKGLKNVIEKSDDFLKMGN